MTTLKFTSTKEFISWVEKQKRFSPKVSLDKMRYYCDLFDNPQTKFPSIHITGTNGKGSVVSYLRTIYQERGLNVGTFTSPYITIFNERISFNNNPINDQELLKIGNFILSKYPLKIGNFILSKYPLIEKDGYEFPSFFEFITLICFIYFANLKDLDLAIIEVGMGGKLDSTNVINPILSVITNVTLEHENILGNTEEAILIQKLGIVKPNTPLVTAIKSENLLKVIKNNLANEQINLIDDYEIINQNIKGSIFKSNNIKYKISLLGEHQILNALTAIKSIELINKLNIDKFKIDLKTLKKGLFKTKWPGRLEIVSKKPLILIDGGHNIDGIKNSCNYIKKLKYKKTRAVVSISADKNLEEMIKILDTTFDEIIFTKYTYARSAESDVLYRISNCQNKQKIESIDDSIKYVYEHKYPLTLFIGSLYLVSEIRPKLLKK